MSCRLAACAELELQSLQTPRIDKSRLHARNVRFAAGPCQRRQVRRDLVGENQRNGWAWRSNGAPVGNMVLGGMRWKYCSPQRGCRWGVWWSSKGVVEGHLCDIHFAEKHTPHRMCVNDCSITRARELDFLQHT